MTEPCRHCGKPHFTLSDALNCHEARQVVNEDIRQSLRARETSYCVYCSDDHPVSEPCPEMLAASAATVAKHTLGTQPAVTIQQLQESARVVESLMKTTRWMLISPKGEMWAEQDPKKLVSVLLTKITPLSPTLVPRTLVSLTLDEWKNRLIDLTFGSVKFTTETGEGETYGEPGTITAHTGPDMQSSAIGVWAPGSHCSIEDIDYGVRE